MRFTYQYEGENTVLCFDTKGTRVTLSALKAEARRLSQLIIGSYISLWSVEYVRAFLIL